MTVYGYARVSTERQADEGVSLDEQIRRIEGRALEQGWLIAETFIERGISGSVSLGDRPEGARLVAALQPGDVVIAAKLDRMFDPHGTRSTSSGISSVGGSRCGSSILVVMSPVTASPSSSSRSSRRLPNSSANASANASATPSGISGEPGNISAAIGRSAGKSARTAF